MQLMTNVRRTDDKNQIFIVCLYLTMFFRAVIRIALERGLDFLEYINPLYNFLQMEEIGEGLEENLDVSQYAKVEYSWVKMKEIREKLENEQNTQ